MKGERENETSERRVYSERVADYYVDLQIYIKLIFFFLKIVHIKGSTRGVISSFRASKGGRFAIASTLYDIRVSEYSRI